MQMSSWSTGAAQQAQIIISPSPCLTVGMKCLYQYGASQQATAVLADDQLIIFFDD